MSACIQSAEDLIVGEVLFPRRIRSSCGKVQHSLNQNLATGLEFAEFAVDGCENRIFNILEARYPDKDPIDLAGKAMFDVFEVSARE